MATKRTSPPRREAAPPVSAERVAPEHPIDTAVDTFFTNDDRVRTAMSRNLKDRGAATLEVAERAKAAFANFTPSKYSPEERARRNFVSSDESTADATRAVVEKGIDVIRASASQRAMRLHVDGGLEQLIDKGKGAKIGKVAAGDLVEYVTTRLGGPISAPTGPAFTECRAEMEAQRRLDEILGDDGETPALDKNAGAPKTDDANELKAEELVNAQVQTQMKTATSPEEELRFAVPSRSDPKQTDKAIETFELRAGPADVTSYHDFNNLQIAFEHVWAEIFDGQLTTLGQELYHEYVKLQEFVGVDPADHSIDTIDDLKQLMAEIRELAKLTNDVTPTTLQPGGSSTGTTSSTNTIDTVVDFVTTVLDPGKAITDAIGDETVAAILNPGGAIIDAIGDAIKGLPKIEWASFPGPLPGTADLISVQIQENVADPGIVEIALQTAGNTRGWKGISFTEFDADRRPLSAFNIANDPNDPNVWDHGSYNVLPLYTPQVANAMLEFWHEGMFGVHTRCYVMAALGEKLTDRRRITFTWLKD